MGKRITKQKIDGRVLNDRDGKLFDENNKKLTDVELSKVKTKYLETKKKDITIYKNLKVFYPVENKKKEILQICNDVSVLEQFEFYQSKTKYNEFCKDNNKDKMLHYENYKRLTFNRAKFIEVVNSGLIEIYNNFWNNPMAELDINNLVEKIGYYKKNYNEPKSEYQIYDENSISKNNLSIKEIMKYQIRNDYFASRLNDLLCDFICKKNFRKGSFKSKLYFLLKNHVDVDYRYFPLFTPTEMKAKEKLNATEYLQKKYQKLNEKSNKSLNDIKKIVNNTITEVYKIEKLSDSIKKIELKKNRYGNNFNEPIEVVKQHYIENVEKNNLTDDQKYILKHTHNYIKKRMAMSKKKLLKKDDKRTDTEVFQEIIKVNDLIGKTQNSVLNKYVMNFKKIAIEQYYIEKVIGDGRDNQNLDSFEKQIFKRDETLKIKLTNQISEVVELMIKQDKKNVDNAFGSKNLEKFDEKIENLLKKHNEFDCKSEEEFKPLLQSLFILRNSILHYSTFNENRTELEERQNIIKGINDYINSEDRKNKINKAISQKFKSNNVYMYYGDEDIEKMMDVIDYTKNKDISLPRFNKVLYQIDDPMFQEEEEAKYQAKKFILQQVYKTTFSEYVNNNELNYCVKLNFNTENDVNIKKSSMQSLSYLREEIQRYKSIYPKLSNVFEKEYIKLISTEFEKYINEKKLMEIQQLGEKREEEYKNKSDFVEIELDEDKIKQENNISTFHLIMGLSKVITMKNLSQLIQNLKKFNQYNLSLNKKFDKNAFEYGFFKFNYKKEEFNELEELITQLEYEMMCKDMRLIEDVKNIEKLNSDILGEVNVLDFYNIGFENNKKYMNEKDVTYNYENCENKNIEQPIIQYENTNSTDGKIYTDGLLQMKKTGTLNYYKNLHEECLLNLDNFKDYKKSIITEFEKFKKNNSNKIENLQEDYQELEKEIKNGIKKNEFEEISKKYRSVRKKIQEYNFYKNVLSLSILKKSNLLNNTLNSRLHAWIYNLEKIERSITEKSNGDIKNFIILNKLNEFKISEKDTISEDIRNDIAHLNRIQEKGYSIDNKSYIDLFNDFILINSYSTKRRNDVIRVFDKILENFCMYRDKSKNPYEINIDDIGVRIGVKIIEIDGKKEKLEYDLISNQEVEYLKKVLDFKKEVE